MLIEFKDEGLYVPQADVYIDPWKPVAKALITHGHADHSRSGMKSYIASSLAVPVIKYRLGSHIAISGKDYGETFTINGVTFSFHPAGHVVGSAQIRVEYKGEVWVVSGDYKIENDGISTPFESVKCHTYITESTFGLPVFRWESQATIMNEINTWWRKNADLGIVSVLSAYSLGKAQRIIQNVDHSIGNIYTHGAVENINEVLRKQGVKIKETHRVTAKQKFADFQKGLVIAPGSAVNSGWSKKFKNFSNAAASGWMAIRGNRRRRGSDVGFVLSDHADWDGLLSSIEATAAERVFVTHGYSDTFSKYLCEQGYDAHVVSTEYTGEGNIENEA